MANHRYRLQLRVFGCSYSISWRTAGMSDDLPKLSVALPDSNSSCSGTAPRSHTSPPPRRGRGYAPAAAGSHAQSPPARAARFAADLWWSCQGTRSKFSRREAVMPRLLALVIVLRSVVAERVAVRCQ